MHVNEIVDDITNHGAAGRYGARPTAGADEADILVHRKVAGSQMGNENFESHFVGTDRASAA